jgi:hypothetical protein
MNNGENMFKAPDEIPDADLAGATSGPGNASLMMMSTSNLRKEINKNR